MLPAMADLMSAMRMATTAMTRKQRATSTAWTGSVAIGDRMREGPSRRASSWKAPSPVSASIWPSTLAVTGWPVARHHGHSWTSALRPGADPGGRRGNIMTRPPCNEGPKMVRGAGQGRGRRRSTVQGQGQARQQQRGLYDEDRERPLDVEGARAGMRCRPPAAAVVADDTVVNGRRRAAVRPYGRCVHREISRTGFVGPGSG